MQWWLQAQRLAAGQTLAYRRVKRRLRQSLEHDLQAPLQAGQSAFLASTGIQDFDEGISAFFAHRPARFLGC